MSTSFDFTAPDSYALNCSTLLTELDVLSRPAAAREAGFTEVEFWWPFDGTPVPSQEQVDGFIQALEAADVQLTGLNFWAGTMSAGDRGVVSHASRRSEFADNIEVVTEIGRRTGCRAFNALYGLRQEDSSPQEQDDVAVANLAEAGKAVASIDGTVLLEPVSGAEGYPLKTAADALAIIERVHASGIKNVRLLADFYHLAVNGDDVEAVIEGHATAFGHIQIADNPGRGAPGTGELPLQQWIQRSLDLGYTGGIALEYKQDRSTAFDWLTG